MSHSIKEVLLSVHLEVRSLSVLSLAAVVSREGCRQFVASLVPKNVFTTTI